MNIVQESNEFLYMHLYTLLSIDTNSSRLNFRDAVDYGLWDSVNALDSESVLGSEDVLDFVDDLKSHILPNRTE